MRGLRSRPSPAALGISSAARSAAASTSRRASAATASTRTPAGEPGPASSSIRARPARPPIVIRASIAAARNPSSVVVERAIVRSTSAAASILQRPASRTAALSSSATSRGAFAWISPITFSRFRAGFMSRVSAASASASRALIRIAGGESARHRLLIDVVQVADRPSLADHLQDRALTLFGDAPALEQLDHRAVGRRGILRPPRRRDVRDPRAEQGDRKETAPGTQYNHPHEINKGFYLFLD